MGEYAKLRGQVLKLGTCEDLYYVRFDDLLNAIRAGQAEKEPNSAEPAEYLGGAFRFRFPFPNEDDQAPPELGAGNFERGLMVPWPGGVVDDAEHERVTVGLHPKGEEFAYRRWAGLPCPQDPKAPADLWRGGESGRRLQLCQQRPIEGALWAVVRCPWCGNAWRLPPAEGEILASAIEAENQPRAQDLAGEGARRYMREVAERIRAGYARDLAAELAGLGVR